MKLVAPNGCYFCELERWQHGSRLDGLHPPNVWCYVAPDDRTRKQRMLRNRKVRIMLNLDGSETMETYDDHLSYWKGKSVTYNGNKRWATFGTYAYPVVDVRMDGKAVQLLFPSGRREWVGVSSVEIVEDSVTEESYPIRSLAEAEEILNPATSTLLAVQSELTRLRERVAELEVAERVLKTL
jgi:hypothetical protein